MSDTESEMGFMGHLEALRWHLIRSFIAILVFSIVAFVSKDFVFGVVILGPSKIDFFTYRMFCKLGEYLHSDTICIQKLDFIIQSRKLTGQFTMHLMSSFVIGFIVSFPYIFWEIWRFISPGMYNKERSSSRGAVFFVSVLFISGVLFGYFMVAPLSINFLANYKIDDSILNEFDITSYVNTVVTIVIANGIMFQLPVVAYFLSKAGLITPEYLKRYRRHSIVIILLISAVITPPDVVSQVLISIPLFFLYEVSIAISKRVVKNKLKAQKEWEES